MLNIPSVLLVNCVGSYFFSVTEKLSGGMGTNIALSYFSEGKLEYIEQDLEIVKAKYKDNPWGYQPVKIINNEKKSIEIDADFFDYLSKNAGLKIKKINIELEDIVSVFNKVDNETSFVICTVDEFYLSKSKFFEKKHNKHFLLIKDMDFINNKFEIIDSEKNRTYQLDLCEIRSAITMSAYKKELFLINGSDFFMQPQISRNNDFSMDTLFIEKLIEDIKKRKNRSDFIYFYQGYYYNINSKVIPYYVMKENFNKDIPQVNEAYKKILSEWKRLSKNMYFKICRGHISGEELIDKLIYIVKIYQNENKNGIRQE